MTWSLNLMIVTCYVLVLIPFGADLKKSLSSEDVPVVSVSNPAQYVLSHGDEISSVEVTQRDLSVDRDRYSSQVKELEEMEFDAEALEIELANLEFVGCYDVWENKRGFVYDSFPAENTLGQCALYCRTLHTMHPLGMYVVGVRGKHCFCPYVDTFRLVRVPNEYCPLICPDHGCPNPPFRTCGGNYSISAYCLKNSGTCSGFYGLPVRDLYAEVFPDILPEITPSTVLPTPMDVILDSGGKMPPCGKCSTCSGNLTPLLDYIPENTPALCTAFCRRKITSFYGEKSNVREPMAYALAGWVLRPPLQEMVPACACSSRLENMTQLPPDHCDTTCWNGQPCGSRSGLQGSKERIVNIYVTGIGGPHDPPVPDPSTTITTEETTTGSTSTSEENFGNEPTSTEPTSTELITTTTQAPDCNGQKRCHGVDPYEIAWTACGGDILTNICPNGAAGHASWKCLDTGQFEGPTPTYTDCSTVWVKRLQDILEQETPDASAFEILAEVENLCVRAKVLEDKEAQYFGHEINGILTMVEQVVKNPNLTDGSDLAEFEKITNSVTLIGDSILVNPRTWKQLPAINSSIAATLLLRTLEESIFELTEEAELIGNTNYENSFQSGSISLTAGVINVAENGRMSLKFDEGGSFIELPPGWESVLPPMIGTAAQFGGMSLTTRGLPKNPFPNNISGLSATDAKVLNGKIMSFSLTRPTANTTIIFPDAGVNIRIQHDVLAWGNGQERKSIRRKLHPGEEPKAIFGTAVCAYWNTEVRIWSQDGCKLIESDSGFTLCECSHLTSFAVLFSYYDYVEKSLALEVLTIVLCSLSVICLMATIIIFTLVRATHSPRTTITKNLAICLLFSNALVLLVVDRNYFNMSEGLCLAAGIVTHYAFLCAFMWMAIEGFHLYKMMVHVFDSGRSHMTIIRVIAYGLPLLLITFTGIIGVSVDNIPYGGEEFCWLNGMYTLAFIIPIGIVICGNLIVLIITLRTAYQVQGAPNQLHDRKRSNRKWVRGCFSITILLGITWIIGYLQMFGAVASEIFAYIFTILNASQGFFLFIYHCLLNEKVRMAAERRNIRYPAWLSEFSPNTNTTSGPSGSQHGNSRFGRQNIRSFYSESTPGRSGNKFSAGGPLEAFGNYGFKLPNSGQLRSTNNSNFRNLNNYSHNSGSDNNGTVSSTSSSTVTSSSGSEL